LWLTGGPGRLTDLALCLVGRVHGRIVGMAMLDRTTGLVDMDVLLAPLEVEVRGHHHDGKKQDDQKELIHWVNLPIRFAQASQQRAGAGSRPL
jgi:hypothetical protein